MPLEEKSKTAAERLSEETGRPIEEFQPDYEEYPMPEYDELEWEAVDDEESSFSDS